MKLPDGWTQRGHLSKTYEHASENLKVAKRFAGSNTDDKWRLFHNGKDVGHGFDTAAEAIEHAEDARIHGG